MTRNNSSLTFWTHPAIIGVLLFSFFYLSYIALTCHIFISADSIGYESLGSLIYKQGWIEFFRQGPSREPLYPFLISISMRIADWLAIPYLSVQKCIQISILLLTQILMFILLRKLKIRIVITALVVLYLAISSNIVISTFIIFSEIVTYPIVLSIILLSSMAWQNLHRTDTNDAAQRYIDSFLSAFNLGLLFVLFTSVKAIASLIVPFFLLPFYVTFIKSLKNKDKSSAVNTFIFLAIFFISFQAPLTLYKFANKKYNGNYTLTNRGPWALYGNTARRMEPLTPKRFMTAIAYVPSQRICVSLLGEDCLFWGQEVSDDLGHKKYAELKNSGMSTEKIDKNLYKLSFKKMLQNPFQYIFLAFLEGAKMFFWESTGIAFIIFPGWITTLYNYPLFKQGTFFLMGALRMRKVFFFMIPSKFYRIHKSKRCQCRHEEKCPLLE